MAGRPTASSVGRRQPSIALALRCIPGTSTRNRPFRSYCIGRADISNASTMGKTPSALLVPWKVCRAGIGVAHLRSSSSSVSAPKSLTDPFPVPTHSHLNPIPRKYANDSWTALRRILSQNMRQDKWRGVVKGRTSRLPEIRLRACSREKAQSSSKDQGGKRTPGARPPTHGVLHPAALGDGLPGAPKMIGWLTFSV